MELCRVQLATEGCCIVGAAFSLHDFVMSRFTEVVRGREDLHPYQGMAEQFVLDNPYCALFIDLGMGKSVISLSAILSIIANGGIDTWLVIAPVRVANETWPSEIGLWRHTAALTYVHVREEDVVSVVNAAGQAERNLIKVEVEDECLWSGMTRAGTKVAVAHAMKSQSNKSRIEAARLVASRKAVRAHFHNNPATIHIINREQVEFLVSAWGRDWPYKGVIIDESSSLKDHTTLRFKALRRVRPLIARMVQLTATPVAESYIHLFAQIYLLDQGERFGKSITRFRETYFTHNVYTRKYKLRPGAEDQIVEKIADIAMTLKAEDYLDAKKPVLLYDNVELSSDEMALYTAMEEESIVCLPSGAEVEAETGAALSQKLLQMASGVLYESVLQDIGNGDFKKRRVVHHIHDRKLNALHEIVEAAYGETLLVAYWHASSLSRLRDAFPNAVVMDPTGKCIKAWNAGKIRMLLVHPQSAGHGLNLQFGGRRIVFFDIPWSLELYLQLIGRLQRQGQTFVVMVHHLIAKDTADESVVEGLVSKDADQEGFFKRLKNIRRKLLKTTQRENNLNIL